MAYKYKLKEIEIGDTKVTGGIKSVVTDKDPDTGAISWSIDYVPNLTKLVEDSMELASTAKGVYQKVKDDKKFLDIYEQAKQLRNVIRTHVRNNYPSDYKKAVREEEEVDEASMSGAAGAYNTPYAFKKKKKSKYKMKTPSGNKRKKLVKKRSKFKKKRQRVIKKPKSKVKNKVKKTTKIKFSKRPNHKTRAVVSSFLKLNDKLKSLVRFNFNVDQSLQNFQK